MKAKRIFRGALAGMVAASLMVSGMPVTAAGLNGAMQQEDGSKTGESARGNAGTHEAEGKAGAEMQSSAEVQGILEEKAGAEAQIGRAHV